jgi:hypothetical protein
MEITREQRRLNAHEKVEELIKSKFYKQIEIAEFLGITYRTFWTRRKEKSWTGKEISVIEGL